MEIQFELRLLKRLRVMWIWSTLCLEGGTRHVEMRKRWSFFDLELVILNQ